MPLTAQERSARKVAAANTTKVAAITAMMPMTRRRLSGIRDQNDG